MSEIDSKVAQANGRLKASKINVKIYVNGDVLNLRATLPPKPDSDKTKPCQQWIALRVPANLRGLQLAEKEARKVGSQLECGEFSWLPYLKLFAAEDDLIAQAPTIATVVSQFETDYFQRRQRNPKSETSWTGDYLAVYKHLPQDAPIDAELLTEAILGTKPDGKQRKRYCMALKALARQAEIGLDTKPYTGNYSPKKVKPRDLPSDELIAEWREKIKNEAWKWVYGMCATFGLRPHEAFHIVELKNEIIEIGEDTKTGSRKVLACYPEWMKEWNLYEISVPKITYKNNKEIGMRFTGYLNQNIGLPFNLTIYVMLGQCGR